MKRFLIVGGFLLFGVVLVALSFVLRSDRTRREEMIRERGQTPTQEQLLQHGDKASTKGTQAWSGILVDAGCPDRTRAAMSRPGPSGSADRMAETPDRNANNLNQDAMEHQVADLASRQMDPGCAITGGTRGFAVYLPNGEFKNLDEGGNTKAMSAFQASPEGAAVMNGRSRGAKPGVELTGRMQGDRIVVESVRFK